MKRWLWFLAAILISTFVYSTIRYGLRPKPIPVLNATEFENPEQIGAVVYRGLRQDIRHERLILLGSAQDVPDYAEIWRGFLKTAFADDVHPAAFFQHEGLKPSWPVDVPAPILFNDAMVTSGELLKQVVAAQEAGKIVVIHGLGSEVSHFFKDSLSRKLDEAEHHPVLSLTVLRVPTSAEDIAAMQQRCLEPDAGTDGAIRTDCAKSRVAKILAKKRSAPGRSWAVMERHGLQEYLVFVKN
jgi:hypothetical protein